MRARSGVALSALACALVSSTPSPALAAGALETVAPEIARQLGAVPAGALVVASPVASDVPGSVATRTDELAVRVAQLVAGQLGATSRAHPQAAPLSVARAASAKSSSLVFVALEIAHGELRATAELYPVMGNAWDRIRVPVPPPRAHVFSRAPVDAEVRGFLPSIPLEQAEIHKVKHDEGDVLAVACGDAGAGGIEIALVSRARVSVGNVQHARFVTRRSWPWSTLGARLPVSLREPLAAADLAEGILRAGTSDRFPVAIDSAGRTAPMLGLPVAGGRDGCVEPDPGADAFSGNVVSCSAPRLDVSISAEVGLPRYDAITMFDAIGRDGSSRRVLAAREPSGKLHVRVGSDTRVVDGAGAQLAAGDLDLDGVPEIIASSDGPDDAISIYSADGTSEPRLRKKLAAPAGVRALAVCPAEAKGVPSLVAVVGPEIWLVR